MTTTKMTCNRCGVSHEGSAAETLEWGRQHILHCSNAPDQEKIDLLKTETRAAIKARYPQASDFLVDESLATITLPVWEGLADVMSQRDHSGEPQR